MRIPRIHLPGPLAEGAEHTLEGTAANHLRVLRLRPGHELMIFDGTGTSYRAVLVALERRRGTVRLEAPVTEDAESPLRTTLVQGISKGDRMDWTIQKAVELGVQAIVPVITARSVVNTDPGRLRKKLGHWHGVAVSACEQCGRNVIPELREPRVLGECWAALPEGPRLFLDPEGGERIRSLQPPEAAACTLLVGPEGGLNGDEVAAARDHGFQPLRMGPRVLRTETAGVVGLTALQTLWGDLG